MRSTRLRAAALLMPLALLPVLSACASEESAPEVASLPTPSAPTTESRTDGDGTPGDRQGSTDTADRPVFRVDDTEQRRTTIWNAYLTCLLDNGAKPPPPDSMYVALGDVAVDLPGPPKARAACQHLEPLQPPALEAATNPDFRDQAVAYVGCLEDGGLYVTLLNSENLDWTYAEGHTVPDDSAELEQECLVEVFGGS
jgi:hypothetical protein